jgi:ubiquinone/menaquinone biosynthesis C-methylase UbiE
MPNRTRARELAAEFLEKGDPTGWFEALYREAEAQPGSTEIPWADGLPNPNLLSFWRDHPQTSANKSALVIGCGPGDDAEQLATWGFQTTAFDISETAIRATRKRFPESEVNYLAADLLAPPPEWSRQFDFVFEANTLQSLPADLRAIAITKIPDFVSPGGRLLIIARGREPSEPECQVPWLLTRDEFSAFHQAGLNEISFEDFLDQENPPVRRFRILYQRS